MNTLEFGDNFMIAWSFIYQRVLLVFTWLDQLTIGGVSLLKISIGLTVLTIVFAVVLPILRTTPVNAGLGSSSHGGDKA